MIGAMKTWNQHFSWPLVASLFAVVLGLATGCAHQGANPTTLTPAAVDAALQPPPLDSIKVTAAQLDHPLMKPLV